MIGPFLDRIRLTSATGWTSFEVEDLRSHLRRFRLTDGLAFIGARSAELWGKSLQYSEGQAITEWDLPVIAQELIRVGSELAPWCLDECGLLRACEITDGLRETFQDTPPSTLDEAIDAFLSFMFRRADQQFPFESRRGDLIPRYRSLFDHLATIELEPRDPDLVAEFRECYGLDMLDFLKIGVAIFMLVTVKGRPVFSAEMLAPGRVEAMRSILTGEKIGRFLDATTLTVEEFRAKLLGRPAPRGLERDMLGPLRRYPIVRTGQGLVVPSVALLVERITAGIYYDFLSRREGDRKAINSFTSLMGRIFQRHVGEELSCHFRPEELFADPSYKNGGWRGPDWTIVEGRKAILIECKTATKTRTEREQAQTPALRKTIREHLAPAVRKLPRKARDVQERVRGLEHWPEIDDFEFVIVTLEPWWPERLTKQLIDEELSHDLAASIPYHLMWIEQLEELGSFRSKTTIFDLLRRRWTTRPGLEIDRYLREQSRLLGVARRSPRMARLMLQFRAQLVGDSA